MTFAGIFWTCYAIIIPIAIPLLAQMSYRHSRFIHEQKKKREAYYYGSEPSAIEHALVSTFMALIWPLAIVAVGSLFLMTKDEREEVERQEQARRLEEARRYLAEQERETKRQFNKFLEG